jgi:two-component system cell cycle response regulator DivK
MTEAIKEAMKNDRRPRVLLVDDYQDTREMYGEYLEFSGFEIVLASNGAEALQRAIDSVPDVILMDLSLPVIDGWEATRRLKADSRTARIPVVAVTGHALRGMSEVAKKAGCDGFITKPCLPEALAIEIRKVLASAPNSTSRKIEQRSGPQARTTS